MYRTRSNLCRTSSFLRHSASYKAESLSHLSTIGTTKTRNLRWRAILSRDASRRTLAKVLTQVIARQRTQARDLRLSGAYLQQKESQRYIMNMGLVELVTLYHSRRYVRSKPRRNAPQVLMIIMEMVNNHRAQTQELDRNSNYITTIMPIISLLIKKWIALFRSMKIQLWATQLTL